MAFVLFVLAGVCGLIAALVGATWIDTSADLLRVQCLLPLAVCLVAFGLAVGARPPRG